MRENLEPKLNQVNCLLEQKKERSSEDFNKKSVSQYNVQNWTQKKTWKVNPEYGSKEKQLWGDSGVYAISYTELRNPLF